MADLDRILRESLHRRAEDAPSSAGLLAAVHTRSARLARRRRAGLVVVTAVAALGVGVVPVVALAGRPGPAARLAAPSGVPAPSPSPSVSSILHFGVSASRPPTFPYRPGSTPVGGLAAPIVTVQAGVLQAYYYAKDPVNGADVRISISSSRPVFAAPAGPVSEVPRAVRGVAGTLRTVAVAPAKQLSLYWQESAGRWVRVDTDDTLTDDEVVQLADTLAPAGTRLVQPLRFAEVPAGMPADTVTPAVVAFRAPGGPVAVTCTVLRPVPVTGPTVMVGSRRAVLVRTAAGVTLTVPFDGVSVRIEVPAGYQVTDADLIHFAAGLSPTDEADPTYRPA